MNGKLTERFIDSEFGQTEIILLTTNETASAGISRLLTMAQLRQSFIPHLLWLLEDLTGAKRNKKGWNIF